MQVNSNHESGHMASALQSFLDEEPRAQTGSLASKLRDWCTAQAAECVQWCNAQAAELARARTVFAEEQARALEDRRLAEQELVRERAALDALIAKLQGNVPHACCHACRLSKARLLSLARPEASRPFQLVTIEVSLPSTAWFAERNS